MTDSCFQILRTFQRGDENQSLTLLHDYGKSQRSLSNMHVYLCFLSRNEKEDVSFPVLFTMYEIYTWEKPDCQSTLTRDGQ